MAGFRGPRGVGIGLRGLYWPALWLGSFGVHDLFHLFVIAGSLAHYGFILKVVVPFGRGHGELSGEPGILAENSASTTSSTSRRTGV